MGTCLSSTLCLVENNLKVCTHVSIGFNASHHVCMSTTACMSKHIYYKVSCVHVYKYVHSFIPFDPCMCAIVNRQPKPYAVSTITSILSCHNSHRLYCHVYTCQSSTQVLCGVGIHIACIYMSASASTQVNIQAFVRIALQLVNARSIVQANSNVILKVSSMVT